MANTSTAELLARCLERRPWTDELLLDALDEDGGRAFFRVIVERLADSFDPGLCEVYVRLFSRVIELAQPSLRALDLQQRYDRVRRLKTCKHQPKRVYVLSRITLGADVAVTSIVLDAVKRRFPHAEIFLTGPRKNWELFAADPRIRHQAFAYPRSGSIQERLGAWPVILEPESIVVDPDSRLSQLGLLPVCDEDRYFFFESRAYGGDRDATLVQLTREWVSEVFGIRDAHAFIAPEPGPVEAEIAVSFGVGDNPEKRLGDLFEQELLGALVKTGKRVLVDEGAGTEEVERVRHLCRIVPEARSWHGAYAPFAHAISRAALYVGYDSAGQHVAAACGTPLVSIFAGYTSERMFQRWRPDGKGRIQVIQAPPQRYSREEVLSRIVQNLTL